MGTIAHLIKIWDNGIESPFPALKLEDIDELKRRTSATHVVAFRWLCDGKLHELPHPISTLPDNTGIVFCEGGAAAGKRLIVVNADGTQRMTIDVPRIDSKSNPKKGYLSLPPSSSNFGGIEWGCEGNDGNTDYLFEFDWKNGKLLRYARPTRPW
jgi:hypothetical protein